MKTRLTWKHNCNHSRTCLNSSGQWGKVLNVVVGCIEKGQEMENRALIITLVETEPPTNKCYKIIGNGN